MVSVVNISTLNPISKSDFILLLIYDPKLIDEAINTFTCIVFDNDNTPGKVTVQVLSLSFINLIQVIRCFGTRLINR